METLARSLQGMGHSLLDYAYSPSHVIYWSQRSFGGHIDTTGWNIVPFSRPEY